ncbi:MAG: hypothetical protein AB7T63_00100 [Planctomycetota bacterium]
MAPPRVDAHEEDGDEDFDEPLTHLDDDAYDEFVGRTFGSGGEEKGDPPIGKILLLVLLAILVVAVLALT